MKTCLSIRKQKAAQSQQQVKQNERFPMARQHTDSLSGRTLPMSTTTEDLRPAPSYLQGVLGLSREEEILVYCIHMLRGKKHKLQWVERGRRSRDSADL